MHIDLRIATHLFMNDVIDLMVFTDLDGTLLDHQTYQSTAAHEALTALSNIGAALVLASSKTPAEIASLRRDFSAEAWPAIVENGAGILPAFAAPESETAEYERLRAELNRLPDSLRACFRGFGDMSVSEIAQITGLTQAQAEQAKARAFSEPGLWTGTADERVTFEALLGTAGVSGQQGGRFFTLSYGATKATRVRELRASYHPKTTIALGDAPNDVEMLENVDYGVIVANPASPDLPTLQGEAEGRIFRTEEPGPKGWNAAILKLLDKLELD